MTAKKSELESENCAVPHILVVEDAPENRKLLRLMLAPLMIRITEAENGSMAFEIFKNESLDLVLMDLEMPIMGGLQAVRLIRTWEKKSDRNRTAILILSAHDDPKSIKDAQDAGSDGFIMKPLERKSLFQEIRSHVQC